MPHLVAPASIAAHAGAASSGCTLQMPPNLWVSPARQHPRACLLSGTLAPRWQVLGELARHPHGARFRRLSQELEEHAAALHGPLVWKMRQWFVEPGARRGGAPGGPWATTRLAGSAWLASASRPPRLHAARVSRAPAHAQPALLDLCATRIGQQAHLCPFVPSRTRTPTGNLLGTVCPRAAHLPVAPLCDTERLGPACCRFLQASRSSTTPWRGCSPTCWPPLSAAHLPPARWASCTACSGRKSRRGPGFKG